MMSMDKYCPPATQIGEQVILNMNAVRPEAEELKDLSNRISRSRFDSFTNYQLRM